MTISHENQEMQPYEYHVSRGHVVVDYHYCVRVGATFGCRLIIIIVWVPCKQEPLGCSLYLLLLITMWAGANWVFCSCFRVPCEQEPHGFSLLICFITLWAGATWWMISSSCFWVLCEQEPLGCSLLFIVNYHVSRSQLGVDYLFLFSSTMWAGTTWL